MENSPSRLPKMPLLPPLDVAFPSGQLSGEMAPPSGKPSGRLPVSTSPAHNNSRVGQSPREREQPGFSLEGDSLKLPKGPVLAKLPLLQFDNPRVARLERAELATIREFALPSQEGLESVRGLPELPSSAPASGPKGRLSPSGLTHLSLTPAPQVRVNRSEVFHDTHLHSHYSGGSEGSSLEPLLGHLSRISRGIDTLVKSRPSDRPPDHVGPIQIPHRRA